MMGASTISWLEGPDGKLGKVWNPTTGCSKVSLGCRSCYAERLAHRFWGDRKFTDVQCHPERLDMPLKWRKPQRVFVDSMSDLFHPDVPDEFIQRVWMTMRGAWDLDGNTLATEDRPGHTYLVLTKRPARMRDFLRARYPDGFELGNVWLGVSIEDQATADERILLLRQIPAAVRWISYEPALAPVRWNLDGIHWIICGSESGPCARPFDLDWARAARDACQTATVPFYLKQTSNRPGQGTVLDGREWREIPQGGEAACTGMRTPLLQIS